MRIFASVAAAIVTGAIFGYIVLALFTGEPILPTGSAADPATAGLKPVASGAAASEGAKADPAASGQGTGKPDDATATAAPDKAASASGDAEVPASVSYLLQYGVFQSEASMDEAVQALTSQGIAAATDTTDGYRVYAGIAAGKAEAEKLAAALTDEELYAKALDNPALSLPEDACGGIVGCVSRGKRRARPLARRDFGRAVGRRRDAAAGGAVRRRHASRIEALDSDPNGHGRVVRQPRRACASRCRPASSGPRAVDRIRQGTFRRPLAGRAGPDDEGGVDRAPASGRTRRGRGLRRPFFRSRDRWPSRPIDAAASGVARACSPDQGAVFALSIVRAAAATYNNEASVKKWRET
ncbi:SPOR domain-containing protein [Cohnella rhizosphaerae]|uniref:SPOR domain-containing protein n=1 Tax=Cohnella rhizosphaerae TaxID=1457232 RepID=A0A9X4KZG1_9BACL|nr:SPOR domain-containing protein [Cohnella rhizosphaerae]MDG0813710.1 SPOR domain-containing protein [Cohnella rhizosphaerae]